MDLRAILAGLGVGAGLAYMLDASKGGRRRALLRDQATHLQAASQDFLETASRDLGNRLAGLAPQVQARVLPTEVSDPVLVERVRAKLGRHVSHPHAITALANQGLVTLTGPILRRERADLVVAIAAVPGVKGVEDRLEAHEAAGNIPALQGGRPRYGDRFELMQANWSPAARLIVGAAGGYMALLGLTRRGLLSKLAGSAGTLLLTRAIANQPLKRVTGIGAGHKAVAFTKTLTINAPVQDVFDFFKYYENFPRFMRHVLELEDRGNGRSHWVVKGPVGVPLRFDCVTTRFVANEVLAWRSEPNSQIDHAGIAHFEENPDGSTRLHIQMAYNPPAGVIGHAVATFLGSNPKQELDQDLNALKTLIEQKTVGAARP